MKHTVLGICTSSYIWRCFLPLCGNGLQALEGASRQDDDVKARIWVARNEARHELWLQESIARKQKQQQLQTHIMDTMRQAHAAEMDAMVRA